MLTATIRSTTIESFRQWLAEEMYVGDDVDQSTIESFIAYSNRPGNAKASKGSFFHSWIETNEPKAWPTSILVDSNGKELAAPSGEFLKGYCGFRFSDEMMLNSSPPTGVLAREVPYSKRFKHNDVVLTVTGTVDAIEATGLSDSKTTASYDYHSYAESMQWKVYCWLTGQRNFRFDVYHVRDPLQKHPDYYRVEQLIRQQHLATDKTDEEVRGILRKWIDFILAKSDDFANSQGIERNWAIKELT